jgi:hypothetical protein
LALFVVFAFGQVWNPASLDRLFGTDGTEILLVCVVVSIFSAFGGNSMTALGKGGKQGSAVLAVLVGGGIAGVIDISVAAISTAMNGGDPMRMLRGIAFALVGPAALKGGLGMSLLGLACHFSITFGAALAYYLVSRYWSLLVREAVLCGLLYGVIVFGVTNFVIVPLSRIGRALPGSAGGTFFGVCVLMIGVGLPIAWATRRFRGED